MRIKKILLTIVCALCTLPALAATFTVGDFQFETIDNNTCTLTKYLGYSTGTVIIPKSASDATGAYSVTKIGANAFAGKDLVSVTIPDMVTTIGASAFSGCWSLTSVKIPNSVTAIENYTFYECRELTSIEIPNSLKTIGAYAFYSCEKLPSVTLPNSVETIGNRAFAYCYSLTSFTIPDKILEIPQYAFYACTNLTSVTIPGSVQVIQNYAFSGCSKLTSLMIPNSVIAFGNYAFYNCTNLTLTLPDNLEYILSGAFCNCKSLTSVTIPSTVKYLLNDAFKGSGLTSATISCPTIGEESFNGCKDLTSVTISSSVTTIEDYAFMNCTKLKDVTVEWSTPYAVKSSVFYGVTLSGVTLHVPIGTGTAYNNTNVWHDFNIVEGAGGSASLTVAPESLNFAAAGETKPVTVTSNVSWTVSKDAAWITLSSGSGSGNGSFNITTAANTTPSQLEGTVTVSGGSITRTVTVNQAAAAPTPSLTISPTSPLNFAAAGGTEAVAVTSNVSWTVSKDAAWITLSPGSGSGNGSFNITTAANTTTNQLTGTVTVTGGSITRTVTVTQAAAATPPPPTSDFEYEVINATTCRLKKYNGAGGAVQIPQTATISGNSYTVTEIGQDAFVNTGITSVDIPLSVTTIGTGAFGNCTGLTDVTVNWQTPLNVNSNVFSGVAIANVELHVPYGTATAYSAANVWKDFKLAGYTLAVSATKLEFEAMGQWKTVTVTSNTAWTVSTTYDWISFTPNSGSGDGQFRVIIDVNRSTNKRTGSITVTAGNLVQFIDIEQEAAELILATSQLDLPAAGGFDHVNLGAANSSVNWTATVRADDASWLTVTPTSGSGGASIEIKATANLSLAQRTGYVSISGGNVIYTITVTQDAALGVSSQSLDVFSPEGGKKTVNLKAPAGFFWTTVSEFSWIEVDPISGSGSVSLGIITQPNTTTKQRTGYVTITFENGVHVDVRVTQSGSTGDFEYEITGTNTCRIIKYNGAGGAVKILPIVDLWGAGQLYRVTEISNSAFDGCTGLTSVTIPMYAETIGIYAFRNCTGLASVTIPASVTTIGTQAFAGCTALRDVTVEWQTPLSLDNTRYVFPVDLSKATLHVPSKTGAAYRGATVWRDFGTIDDGSVEYHSGDMIILSGALKMYKNYEHFGLSDGFENTPDWIEKVAGVSWNDESPKRITNIYWPSRGLYGGLDVTGLEKLVGLDVSYNEITSVNVEGLQELQSVNCANNVITMLSTGGNTKLKSFSCSRNLLKFASLPLLPNVSTYIYAPQTVIKIEKTSGTIDLREYQYLGKTKFNWYYSDTKLNDITEVRPGVFSIPADYNGKELYCRMTNGDYPQFDNYPLVCTITVSGSGQTPPVAIEQTPTGTGAVDENTAMIDVKAIIPPDAKRMTGFLRAVPENREINPNSRKAKDNYMNKYNGYLEMLGEENAWNTEFGPKPVMPLSISTRAQKVEATTVLTLYYDISPSLANGDYTVRITDLRIDFDNGTSYRESEVPVTITVARSVGNEPVASSPRVTCYGGVLTVVSPSAERVAIYSASGVLLGTVDKSPGTVTCIAGHLPHGVLIVRGDSGWVRKALLE
jgi:hypothetical protein